MSKNKSAKKPNPPILTSTREDRMLRNFKLGFRKRPKSTRSVAALPARTRRAVAAAEAVTPQEKEKRLRVIWNCVVTGLAEVSGTDKSKIGPNTSIAGDLGIDSPIERNAAGSRIGACLGVVVSPGIIAVSGTVWDLVEAIYEAIFGEKP